MQIGEVQNLPTSLVRILHVDDCPVWKLFIEAYLEQQPNLRIVGHASDGMEAVKKAEQLQPDLILLDVSMPVLNGIQSVLQIRKFAPRAVILFLSQELDPDLVRAALDAGAHGYIHKTEVTRDLVAGIEAVLRGERFVSRILTDYDDPT